MSAKKKNITDINLWPESNLDKNTPPWLNFAPIHVLTRARVE